MSALLEKISSYNIFNYLLPGIIFVVLTEAFTSFSFVQEDILLGIFLYYFIGLVISRIGSLIIEPVLKFVEFVKLADYLDFVNASATDEKLYLLAESNNMYRTFCSLIFLLIILKIFENIVAAYPIVGNWNNELLLIGLVILFCFSYKKQTKYITKRIENTVKKG